MRTIQPIAAAVAVAGCLFACAGTEGDVLRTRSDGGHSGAAGAFEPTGGTGAGGAGEPPRLLPDPGDAWQIQLSGALDTSLDVDVYVADFETDPTVIRRLHDADRIVVCYLSAGTVEAFRGDADRFPESALGAELENYPDERYVDIRRESVRAIMEDRVGAAQRAGCDGLHPSGLAAFSAPTGLDFGRSDQLDYNRWLASVARARGLGVGLVDGDASLIEALASDFDWVVVWSCADTGCPQAAPFTAAGKPALLVEFGDADRAAEVCPRADELKLSAIVKRNANFDAFRAGCP